MKHIISKHQAAVLLGDRRATVAGEKGVKVGKTTAKHAAEKLGHSSHTHSKKKK